VLFAEQALPEIQRLNPAPINLSSVA